MEELIFNSVEEACQMLADVTGKKIVIPDKAEPTVASQADADQISDEISEEEANEATTAESEITQKIDQKIDDLSNLKTEVESAMSQVEEITGS